MHVVIIFEKRNKENKCFFFFNLNEFEMNCIVNLNGWHLHKLCRRQVTYVVFILHSFICMSNYLLKIRFSCKSYYISLNMFSVLYRKRTIFLLWKRDICLKYLHFIRVVALFALEQRIYGGTLNLIVIMLIIIAVDFEVGLFLHWK